MISIFQGTFKGVQYDIYSFVTSATTPGLVQFLLKFSDIQVLLESQSTQVKAQDLNANWIRQTIKSDPYLPNSSKVTGYTSFQTTVAILGVLDDIIKHRIGSIQNNTASDCVALRDSLTQATQHRYNDSVNAYIASLFITQENTVQQQLVILAQQQVVIDGNNVIIAQQLVKIAQQEARLATLNGQIDDNDTEIATLTGTQTSNATAITTNETTITGQESEIAANVVIITGQESKIAANEATIKALDDQITAQETAMATNETTLTGQTQQKNAINTAIDTANTTIAGQETTMTSNTATITAQTNLMTAQQQRISYLGTVLPQLSLTQLGIPIITDHINFQSSVLLGTDFKPVTFQDLANTFNIQAPMYTRYDFFCKEQTIISTELTPLSFKQNIDNPQQTFNIEYRNCAVNVSQLTKKITSLTLSTTSQLNSPKSGLTFFLQNTWMPPLFTQSAFSPLASITTLKTLSLSLEYMTLTLDRGSGTSFTTPTSALTTYLKTLIQGQVALTSYTMSVNYSLINSQGFSDLFLTPFNTLKTTITTLNINLSWIVYPESSLQSFFGAIAQCTLLTSLSLRLAGLNNFVGGTYISTAIQSLTLISVLNIWALSFYSPQAAFLNDLLLACSKPTLLTSFVLRCDSRASGITTIPVFSVLSQPTLKSFYFNINEAVTSSAAYDSLAPALTGNTTLTDFNLTLPTNVPLATRNNIVNALSQCPLQSLSFWAIQPAFDQSSMDALASLLNSRQTLTYLSLTLNQNTTTVDLSGLFNSIATLVKLQELYLSLAFANSASAALISCFVALKPTLTRLIFSATCDTNEIATTTSAAEALANLTQLTSLQWISDLRGLNLTQDQFVTYQGLIATGLTPLVNLTTLSVSVYSTGQTANNPALYTAVNALPSLYSINVNFSGFTVALAAAALDLMTNNNLSSVSVSYDSTQTNPNNAYVQSMINLTQRVRSMTSMQFLGTASSADLISQWQSFVANANNVNCVTSFTLTSALAQDTSVTPIWQVLSMMPQLNFVTFYLSAAFSDQYHFLFFRALGTGYLTTLNLTLDYYQFTANSVIGITTVLNSNICLVGIGLSFGVNCTAMSDAWLNAMVTALSQQTSTNRLQLTASGTVPYSLTDASLSNLYSYLSLRMSLIYFSSLTIQLSGSAASVGVKAQFASLPVPSGTGYVFSV